MVARPLRATAPAPLRGAFPAMRAASHCPRPSHRGRLGDETAAGSGKATATMMAHGRCDVPSASDGWVCVRSWADDAAGDGYLMPADDKLAVGMYGPTAGSRGPPITRAAVPVYSKRGASVRAVRRITNNLQ